MPTTVDAEMMSEPNFVAMEYLHSQEINLKASKVYWSHHDLWFGSLKPCQHPELVDAERTTNHDVWKAAQV